TYTLGTLLEYGDKSLEESQKQPQKKPVYTRDELREVAEFLASKLIDTAEADPSGYASLEYMDEIEKFAPARALQLRAKSEASEDHPARPSRGNTMSNTGLRTSSSNSNVSRMSNMPPEVSAAEQRQKAQKQLLENVRSIGKKELPKEQRDKFVDSTRKLIMSSAGKETKITTLCLLAGQVARLGDRDLADDIMADAERLLPSQPKNYQDFLLTWMVISGYADVDPDKAFPLLNGAISRINDTLGALIKVGEFIDVNDEFIEDGEAQIGAFGGSMVRGFTSELALFGTTATIRSLALSDFKKTAAAANTFERTEARVLAKMLILRAVLDKTPPKPDLLEMIDDASH
ncbi:MAG: hypothetical protein ACJ73D_01810, partial [Pyrinomonadaceae bacterium]